MLNRKVSTTLMAAMIVVALHSTPLAADQLGSKGLAGSWIGTVTATDPPGMPPMKTLLSFTKDGIVIESRRLYVGFSPFGPLMETAGHGEWVSTGNREFSVKFIFLIQRGPVSDGGFVGTDTILMKLTLDQAGDGVSGTFVSEVRDPGENLVFVASGVVQAARIRAALTE